MRKEQLREFYERDRKYREDRMIEKIDELIRQTEILKQDLESGKKRFFDDKCTKGNAFDYIREEMRSHISRFNTIRMDEIAAQWEKANEVLKVMEHLEKEQD